MSLMPAARWQEAGSQQLERSLDVKADRGSTATGGEVVMADESEDGSILSYFALLLSLGQGKLCSDSPPVLS